MKSSSAWDAVTGVSALGAAVAGGVFFAFSTFVMRGLTQIPAPDGIRAMQAINRTAVEAPFMILLNGSGLLAIVVAVRSLTDVSRPGAWWVVSGAGLYVVGAWLVTGVFNIPRNNRLDRLDPDAPGSAATWTALAREWTYANHARTVLCVLGAAALAIGVLEAKSSNDADATSARPAFAAPSVPN
jgi:uncharacterized membrane protein